MVATAVLRRGSIAVIDYRCGAGPADASVVERHEGFSVSYVRRGSFGYRVRGVSFDLVTGSTLAGHPGDELTCTHDHAYGDECLSFELAPELVESMSGRLASWRSGGAYRRCPSSWYSVSLRWQPPTTGATSASRRRECCLRRVSSRSPLGESENLGRLGHEIAAARWKRRRGSTRGRMSRSISKAPLAKSS